MRLASLKGRRRAHRAESGLGRLWAGAAVAVALALVAALTATAASADDDGAGEPAVQVRFASAGYTAAEGGDAAEVTVLLSEAPQRSVVIGIESQLGGSATAQDHSAIPASVAFAADETAKSFRVTAVDDSEIESRSGEFVALRFGNLPAGVSPGRPAWTTVALEDNDGPDVEASFASAAQTALEGGAPVNVTVVLSEVPLREVVVPITVSHDGGAEEADYRRVPASVTFEGHQTRRSFQIEAVEDGVEEAGEAVSFSFGQLPEGVSSASPSESTVALQDFFLPEVEASFARTEYTAVEGGAPVDVTVVLSAAPQREVVLPIVRSQLTGADKADYRGVPDRVVFEADETRKSFRFEAIDDALDESGEWLFVWFGDLPEGVSRGNPEWSSVLLEDPAPPEVEVRFESVLAVAVEGGPGAELTLLLSEIPRRRVVVPLTFSVHRLPSRRVLPSDNIVVPESVTFESYQRSRSFLVGVLDDDENVGARGVAIDIGDLPDGVVPNPIQSTAGVSITDTDPRGSRGP